VEAVNNATKVKIENKVFNFLSILLLLFYLSSFLKKVKEGKDFVIL
jgi:hypothetical protein